LNVVEYNPSFRTITFLNVAQEQNGTVIYRLPFFSNPIAKTI